MSIFNLIRSLRTGESVHRTLSVPEYLFIWMLHFRYQFRNTPYFGLDFIAFYAIIQLFSLLFLNIFCLIRLTVRHIFL